MKVIVWLGVYCAFDEAFEWHFPQRSEQCDCEHFLPQGYPDLGKASPQVVTDECNHRAGGAGPG